MAQDPRSRTRWLWVRRVPVVVLVCLFGFFSMGRLPLLVAQSTLGDPLPEVLKNEQDDSTLRRFEAQKLAMGVLFKLVGYAESEEQARFATAEAFSRIDFLNSVFSDYDPSSETSRLSRDASPGNWLGVSSDMHRVLSTSQKISKASSGAFDLTVGPLSHLWRNVRKTQSLPAIDLLEAAQQKVDAQSVEVHPFAHLVRFKRGNIDLDFGGQGLCCGSSVDSSSRKRSSLRVNRCQRRCQLFRSATRPIFVGGCGCPIREKWSTRPPTLDEAKCRGDFGGCVAVRGD